MHQITSRLLLLFNSVTSARCTDTVNTRSTQRAQTSTERQHNRNAERFLQCKLDMQLWSESTRYFFDNPVNLDFGLRTPGSGRWSGLSPKFNHLVHGPCRTPPRIFVKICFSYPTDRQTDRQTDRGNYTVDCIIRSGLQLHPRLV